MVQLLAALSGAVIWVALAALGGRVEAWDSPLYFPVGMPVALLAAGLFGAAAPKRAWRWGGWLMVGEAVALLLTTGPGALLPLGLVLFAVLSLPCMVAALIGAWLGRRPA